MSELETKCDTPVSRKRVTRVTRFEPQYERGVLVLGALCMTSALVDVGAFVWAMVTGVRCQMSAFIVMRDSCQYWNGPFDNEAVAIESAKKSALEDCAAVFTVYRQIGRIVVESRAQYLSEHLGLTGAA